MSVHGGVGDLASQFEEPIILQDIYLIVNIVLQ